jgi:hypothetical protein
MYLRIRVFQHLLVVNSYSVLDGITGPRIGGMNLFVPLMHVGLIGKLAQDINCKRRVGKRRPDPLEIEPPFSNFDKSGT